MRKMEFFDEYHLLYKNIIMSNGMTLHHQERDWTCSLACIRTIVSSIFDDWLSEDELVEKYNMKPSPYFSKDIKEMGILKEFDTSFGCDSIEKDFNDLIGLLNNGYKIMIESMYGYSHWLVLLGYIPINNADIEKSQLLLFDPYYNQVRLVIVDEFISMWKDGNYEETKVEMDYIAIRNK